MGIHKGSDKKSKYFQNGSVKTKYYYIPSSIKSIKSAYDKARNQQKAMFANNYHVKRK